MIGPLEPHAVLGADGVKLAWVADDGRIVKVSSFVNLAPSARPVVSCPACGERVVLKLGKKVAHHAAHRPASKCAVTAPETALHYNTKMHVADQLQQRLGVAVTISQQCGDMSPEVAKRDRCQEWNPEIEPLPAWDGVQVETRLDRCVPDLLLLDRGKPVLAIEIVHSHAVGEEKRKVLARLAIPWIEVKADHELFGSSGAWTPAKSLPVVRCGGLDEWHCTKHKTWLNELRTSITTMYARAVDAYDASGDRQRYYWRVEQIRFDDKLTAIRASTQHKVFLEVPTTEENIGTALTTVSARYKKWVASVVKGGAIYDSPMKWLRGEDVTQQYWAMSDDTHPPRYVWTRFGRWWMPPDLKAIVWDGVLDKYGMHPVVTARKAELRRQQRRTLPRAGPVSTDERQ